MTSEEYRIIRRRIGLTQKEAAKYLGMTQQAISRIESGSRRPTIQQAAAIRLLAIIKEHGSGSIRTNPCRLSLEKEDRQRSSGSRVDRC